MIPRLRNRQADDVVAGNGAGPALPVTDPLPTSGLTFDERVELGRAARETAPRSSHAEFAPGPDRADPVALLREQEAARVTELLPIRYGRMVATPFTFLRGSATVMASDLDTTPRTGLTTQVCGDAHLANFGVFGSPERRLVFDLNDFDETLPGPWEWDVKRLAASLAVAGRHREFGRKVREAIVGATVRKYREAMLEFAQMRHLDVWYANVDVEQMFATLREQDRTIKLGRVDRSLRKARTRDSLREFGKLTEVVDGKRRIVSRPPLITPVAELVDGDVDRVQNVVRQAVASYRESLASDRRHLFDQYRFVDLARKVVGVGSVGTRAWIVLFLGRDENDPLFLQVKEAQASVLERFVGASTFPTAGQRVVEGQRLMQSASDALLGWQRGTGIDDVDRDFYVRQLKDWKGSANVEKMGPPELELYGELCGWTLAKAHARSGDRVALAAYLGKGDKFDRAITEFAERYADQTEHDHAVLRSAVDDGSVAATEGV